MQRVAYHYKFTAGVDMSAVTETLLLAVTAAEAREGEGREEGEEGESGIPSEAGNTPARNLTELLVELICANDPKARIPRDLEHWVGHIERLHRLDGRDDQEIEAVIRWSQADEFWRANILSTRSLREKFPQLLLQMKRKTSPSVREDVWATNTRRFQEQMTGNDAGQAETPSGRIE